MNVYLLCCAALLAGGPPVGWALPTTEAADNVAQASRQAEERAENTGDSRWTEPTLRGVRPSESRIDAHFHTGVAPVFTRGTVVRGQSPGPTFGGSSGFPETYTPPTYAPPPVYQPNEPTFGPMFGGGPQPLGDPFLGNGAAVVDYVPGALFPYQFFQLGQPPAGGHTRVEFGYLPPEAIDGGGQSGDFGITEFDLESRRILQQNGSWILSMAGQYGMQWWEGPPGGFGLPSEVYSFGTDIELRTAPDGGPWGAVVAFSPSINTDFETNLRSDAYNWDGRAYLTYRHSATVAFVGGVGYWDRVNDRFIPYGGVIWKPDSRWEVQATVPEARISYFLGNGCGGSRWLYARAEYHVDAYQVETSGASRGGYRQTDKIELQDYRLLIGYAHSNGFVDAFIEAGWVLGREVDFLSNTVPDFDIDDGFIGRVGVRF